MSDVQTPVRAVSTEQVTRNASLGDLARTLESEHGRKHDVVLSSRAIRAEGGALLLEGTEEHEITMDGVTTKPVAFLPTAVCDSGIAEKLKIHGSYLRRLRAEDTELYDINVNRWLQRDERSFLVRTLRGDQGRGVARAFLSDTYKLVDNIDVLFATLDGIRAAGVEVNVSGCDLSERKMYVRVEAPGVRAYAPTLTRGYRSPFDGGSGEANPVVWAGFEISNSETGCGAFSIVPRFSVRVCKNGLTIPQDVDRSVHLGKKLEQGRIAWSEDTQRKNLELITAQTRDTVATFLDPAYIEKRISEIERKAGAPVADVEKTLKVVSKQLNYTEDQRKGLLSHFIQGGTITAGGVLHAVTSYAQTVADPDEASELEWTALRAMDLAAAL